MDRPPEEIENCQKITYIFDRRFAVQRLTEQILVHTEGLPEGAPIAAKGLLHLGNRAAVDQALSRLATRGRLMRAGRGVYLRPVSSRFGVRAPSVEKARRFRSRQRFSDSSGFGLPSAGPRILNGC